MDLFIKCKSFEYAISLKLYAERLGLEYDNDFTEFTEDNFESYDVLMFNEDKLWHGIEVKDFSLISTTHKCFELNSLDKIGEAKSLIYKFYSNKLKEANIETALSKSKKILNRVVLSTDYKWRLENNMLVAYEKENM